QESYADTNSSYDDFAIFRYVITNTSGRNLSNLYTGLFFDWDINENAVDFANYDRARMMGIMQNRLTSPTILTAAQVLTRHASPMFRAISNPAEIYGGEGDGFTADEKWNYLSGGIQTLTQSNLDASTLSGIGPFSLAANESAEISYAVIGASSLSELQENADNAQEYWDSIISPSYSNHSPLFTKGLSDTAITTDETLIFTYVAEDPEEDDLTFSLMSPPRNASIDPVSGTMTYLSDDNFGGDQKTETITVVVSDGEFVGTTNTSITTEKLGDLLSQSYANPLSLSKHEETRIDYHLAKEGKVSLVVYDILGREVKTLVNDTKPEGKYSAFWNAHDNQGRRVSTGIYLYRIQAGDFIETRKIVVLK
ncbi:MAG: T9SS type A sorting domain-containing protein, partial [Fidelibacterota bacterium]